MDYRELWKEENEAVRERYQLTMERIGQIKEEETVPEAYREYFTERRILLKPWGRCIVWWRREPGELRAWKS